MRRSQLQLISLGRVLVLWSLMLTHLLAQSPKQLDINELKALYIFNFTKFVDWPAEAFETDDTPFRIAIVGRSDIAKPLELLCKSKTIKGRLAVVVSAKNIEDLKSCHVVVPSKSGRLKLAAFTGATPKRALLTIGEGDQFVRQGGMIGLVIRDKKLRYQVNLKSSKAANLDLRAQFIRGAQKIVK